MNKFLVIIIFFFISSCAYEPILSKKNYNFEFKNISYEGNKKINNIIRNKLVNKNSSEKKYDIFFQTSKEKITVALDKKGDPTIFKITISLNYEILEDGEKIQSNTLKKHVTYNNIDDKFELSQKEDDILIYLSENLADEILNSVLVLDK